MNIKDKLPDAQLFRIGMVDDYYEKIIQFLATGMAPEGFTTNKKKQLVVQAMYFQLIAEELYNMGPNEILHRCVLHHEQERIFMEPHARVVGGHYGGRVTSRKVLRAGLWWLTLNGNETDYARTCDVFQRMGKMSQRYDMTLIP